MDPDDVLATVAPLARRCRAAGGIALVVGGAVRDILMARHGLAPPTPHLDLDVEVHGVVPGRLEKILGGLGAVNLVGHAFAVYKLRIGENTLDVSIPRRDSKVGPGHKGLKVTGDPELGLVEAARRRDLTINAMAMDPLTGDLQDPFGGLQDLKRRLLRAVDPATFVDDPLRALRVLQFAARFRFRVHRDLLLLCRHMPITELPGERVRGEIQKLLMLSPAPSWGVAIGHMTRSWHRICPELAPVAHRQTCLAVDRAATTKHRLYRDAPARGEALMLAALLHRVPPSCLETALDRLVVHRLKGFPQRTAVLAMVERAPTIPPDASSATLRHLARDAEQAGGLALWLGAAEAITGEARFFHLMETSFELGIHERPPPPLVRGRDLLSIGIPVGTLLGRILEELYRVQLDQGITSPAPLLELASQLWRREARQASPGEQGER